MFYSAEARKRQINAHKGLCLVERWRICYPKDQLTLILQ